MQETNEELVALYLEGNEEAFAELTHRTLGSVYSFALRFTGQEQDAQDIAQETFVKVWKNLKRYRPETSKFTTWVMRIARNTAVDSMRKRKHVPFSAFDMEGGKNQLEETLPDTGKLAETIMIETENVEELQEMLTRLPPPQRDVLVLHYTNHLTFEEIGEALGEPTNTVKSRHYRALLALRKMLTGA